jgi:hypothetical protein
VKAAPRPQPAPATGHRSGHTVTQPRVRTGGVRRAGDVASGAGVPAGPSPRRLWGLGDTAQYLGVSPWTVRELEWKGTLRRVRLPGVRRLLFDSLDVAALVERSKRPVTAGAPAQRDH